MRTTKLQVSQLQLAGDLNSFTLYCHIMLCHCQVWNLSQSLDHIRLTKFFFGLPLIFCEISWGQAGKLLDQCKCKLYRKQRYLQQCLNLYDLCKGSASDQGIHLWKGLSSPSWFQHIWADIWPKKSDILNSQKCLTDNETDIGCTGISQNYHIQSCHVSRQTCTVSKIWPISGKVKLYPPGLIRIVLLS